LTETSLCGAYL